MKNISKELLDRFQRYLMEEEKAKATIEKYIRDVAAFSAWLDGRAVCKLSVLAYKEWLIERYAPTSVNSMLSSLNSFFVFCEWRECQVKTLKIQRQIFSKSEKELTKAEYKKLVQAARQKGNERLSLLMQTICATGIRISELRFITKEAVQNQQAVIRCKGKMRVIILPKQLCKMLKGYINRQKIERGSVFQTRTGKPIDRSNIWKDMRSLCESAGVSKDKVFPHNLRHLFGRTYYSLQKDVVRLADILGHSNVNTTRIYTMESGQVHRRQIQKLDLLLC